MAPGRAMPGRLLTSSTFSLSSLPICTRVERVSLSLALALALSFWRSLSLSLARTLSVSVSLCLARSLPLLSLCLSVSRARYLSRSLSRGPNSWWSRCPSGGGRRSLKGFLQLGARISTFGDPNRVALGIHKVVKAKRYILNPH